MNTGVPFDARPLAAIDRTGSTWTAFTDVYRLARIDSAGDTALVIQLNVQGLPITSEERDRAQSIFSRAGVDPVIPEQKPVLERLYADDENRLWVERARDPDAPRRFDVYDAEGEYVGSLLLPADVVGTPVIRNGHIYSVARDELDVSYVVRAPIPDFGRDRP